MLILGLLQCEGVATVGPSPSISQDHLEEIA